MIPENILLSIAMVASFMLVLGGWRTITRGGERLRGILMIVAALVLLGNVVIWAWPLPH